MDRLQGLVHCVRCQVRQVGIVANVEANDCCAVKKMKRTIEASITSWRSVGVARRHHGLQCDADECGSRHRGTQGRPAGAELYYHC